MLVDLAVDGARDDQVVVRSEGGEPPPVPNGLEIRPVRTVEDLDEFTTTLIEAFPVPELEGLPLGGYGPALLDVDGWHLWVGRLDGHPVEWIRTAPRR